VLELGCGTGNLQLALAKTQTHKAVGLDASPQMLALTRAKLSRSGHLAPVLRGDARALPFPHASFDTLVATFPSEYIAEPTTLLEARRVLRPGGRIVIILAAHFVRSNLYRQVVNLLYRITLQRPVLTPVTPDPRTFLGERVAEAGFMVREQWVPAAEKNVQLHFIVGELPGDANS
jgi:ubiquinone/menaquinone biosynthesis C-methylase UbiE